MRNRRSKQFIDSAVQGELIARILFHWLLFFAATLLALPLWRIMVSTGFTKPFFSLMLDGWMEMAPIWILLLAMFPVFAWDTVTFSHRFAGPMVRFRNTIRRLAAGEHVPPIRLREGDFWKEMADDFNLMLARLGFVQLDATGSGDPQTPCPVADDAGETRLQDQAATDLQELAVATHTAASAGP